MKLIDIKTIKNKSFKNLTGKKFGRLTVIGLTNKKSGRKRYWLCECYCGNTAVVRSDSLVGGKIRSCGCLKKEQDKINLTANWKGHNRYKRLYEIWQSMKKRCLNHNDENYCNYGSRGIDVYNPWINDFDKFKFWAFTHGYQNNLTLDRIDNNKGYYPDNCRWVDMKTQCNNRRSNVVISWNGKTQTLKQWSEEMNINYGTLRSRYKDYGFKPPKLFWSKDKLKVYNDQDRLINWKGQKLTLKQWSDKLGLKYVTLKSRHRRGIEPPDLFKPIKSHKPKTIPR